MIFVIEFVSEQSHSLVFFARLELLVTGKLRQKHEIGEGGLNFKRRNCVPVRHNIHLSSLARVLGAGLHIAGRWLDMTILLCEDIDQRVPVLSGLISGSQTCHDNVPLTFPGVLRVVMYVCMYVCMRALPSTALPKGQSCSERQHVPCARNPGKSHTTPDWIVGKSTRLYAGYAMWCCGRKWTQTLLYLFRTQNRGQADLRCCLHFPATNTPWCSIEVL